MKEEKIEELMDSCLLTDEEMVRVRVRACVRACVCVYFFVYGNHGFLPPHGRTDGVCVCVYVCVVFSPPSPCFVLSRLMATHSNTLHGVLLRHAAATHCNTLHISCSCF